MPNETKYTRHVKSPLDEGKQGFRTPHKFIKGVEHKYCTWHLTYEPISSFSIRSNSWDGLASVCSEIVAYKKRLNYIKNKKEKLKCQKRK